MTPSPRTNKKGTALLFVCIHAAQYSPLFQHWTNTICSKRHADVKGTGTEA